MKKILSLALALLMMLPLAIGTSAASNTIVTVSELQALLEYWQLIDDKHDYDSIYDYLYGDGCDTTASWPDKCDICNRNATYYISKGKVYCSCPKCGTHTIKVDTSCADCNCGKCSVSDVVCECVCKACKCNDVSGSLKPVDKINHRYSDCEWDDIELYRSNGKIYWYCTNCKNDGVFWVETDTWYDYTLTVYCSRGGDYYIDGSHDVVHGETRTITFEADRGYVLYDVTVDGESYGPKTKLELTVTEDLVIRATFVRENTLSTHTITSSSTGNGTIKAYKNGTAVDASKITAKYSDTITFKFNPVSSSYSVKNVVVNGKSMGALKTYTIDGGITKDVDIKVTFKWNNPYNDVAENYLDAVEYVTEAGIMGFYNKYVNKNAFAGTKEITVRNLAAALAEMADVNEKLDTVDERIEWAEKNGIIDGDADLSVICTVQAACDIVNEFLCVLEDKGDIDFEDFDDDDSAKENALSIGLVSEKTYKNNRNLKRYDLAAICYLLANLEID